VPLKGATRFLEDISSQWLRDNSKKNDANKSILYGGAMRLFVYCV
jgi:hypothetical protein